MTNYIPLRKAAEIAGYTPEYFRQLAKKGKIKTEKVSDQNSYGFMYMISEDEVKRIMEKNR